VNNSYTWKFPHSLPRCAQYAVTEGIVRQTLTDGSSCHGNEMRSRHNVEDVLIRALSCIELRTSLLSNSRVSVLHINCSARRVIESCFYFCSVHVQQ